jgi:transposase
MVRLKVMRAKYRVQLDGAEDKLKGLEPDVRKRLRDERLRPHVEAFFVWAQPEHQKVRGTRGPLSSALGYSINQEDAL